MSEHEIHIGDNIIVGRRVNNEKIDIVLTIDDLTAQYFDNTIRVESLKNEVVVLITVPKTENWSETRIFQLMRDVIRSSNYLR
ncbi:MAG: hypothetical protein KDK91_34350 [Gammaproteobacteria bacterium]|nr:hypothetical protein [Gammaproteobacteria bacterium]